MPRTTIACVAGFGLLVAMFASVPQSTAQTFLPIGTVTNVQGPQNCPSGRNFDSGLQCYSATLSGCQNNGGTDNLDFWYGVANPNGTRNGTIVMLPGGGGGTAADAPADLRELEQYVNAGYQVVQIAWGKNGPVDWEWTNSSNGTGNSILNAACRPASFLYWVRHGGL